VSGIGVVFNPKSKHNLRDPSAAARLARRLGDGGTVREARSLDELYRIAEDFRRADIDVLAISGGDGTNHVTLTGFIDVYGGGAMPQVALLRGGTMNTVANSVGVRRGKPEGLLGRLMRDYARRAVEPLENVERFVMRVASDRGGRGDRAQYGFLFGTGVVHGFLAEYNRGGEPSPLVAVKTLARGIGSALVSGHTIRRIAQPFRGAVHFEDGTSWPMRDYLAIAAGTISHIGLNFKPFHRHAEEVGAFHALAIDASPLSFIKELPRIHAGLPMRPGRAREAVSHRMTLTGESDPVRYMIDGDLHESPSPIHVTSGPAVRLIVLR